MPYCRTMSAAMIGLAMFTLQPSLVYANEESHAKGARRSEMRPRARGIVFLAPRRVAHVKDTPTARKNAAKAIRTLINEVVIENKAGVRRDATQGQALARLSPDARASMLATIWKGMIGKDDFQFVDPGPEFRSLEGEEAQKSAEFLAKYPFVANRHIRFTPDPRLIRVFELVMGPNTRRTNWREPQNGPGALTVFK